MIFEDNGRSHSEVVDEILSILDDGIHKYPMYGDHITDIARPHNTIPVIYLSNFKFV